MRMWNKRHKVRALASRAIRIRQAAAGRAHTLFLSASGTVYSCGSNELGQQGSAGNGNGNDDGVGGEGIPAHDVLAPRVVAAGDVTGGGPLSGLVVESVAAGNDHCAAVTAPRAGHAPGSGGDGCGDRGGVKGARELSKEEKKKEENEEEGEGEGGRRSRVFTWGSNAAGQCVQGRAAEVVLAPQEAELLSGARAVGCGAGHTMVVL